MTMFNFIIIPHVPFSCSQTSEGTISNQEKCSLVTDYSSKPQIIIFFAPLTTDEVKQQIVVYYYNNEITKDDKIAIYETDPQTGKVNLFYFFKPSTRSGIIRTGLAPKKLKYLIHSTYNKHCLGYSGAWIRNGRTVKMTCLSSQPEWMSERMQILQNRTLQEIFIPGTHNSGSYSENPVQTVIEKFTVTQDRDVLEQLISGVRYLDIRPAFYDEYWVNHESYKMNPMKNIIDDVKTFLDNTLEIIILSFKEFPKGFESDTDHINFIKYLETEFKGYFLPTSNEFEWNVTLGHIWKTDKRLIMSYDHNICKNTSSMWSPIKQYWGDVQDLAHLRVYIEAAEEMPQPRAVMAQLTFDTWGIIKNVGAQFTGQNASSILQLGAMVGPHITQCSFIFICHVPFSCSQTSDGTTSNQENCGLVTDYSLDSQIIIFFAPLNGDEVKQQIVVYYYNETLVKNDKIAIYETDPEPGKVNIIYLFEPTTRSGIIYTGIAPKKLKYKLESTYNKHCLGYSGAWVQDGKVMRMMCLSSQPEWMSERKQILQNRTLQELFIPGTHDSGSYSENPIQTIIEKFTVTQDSDVLEQLISGARYLDIRPAFYHEYWVNHGSYKMNPMKNIIDDVKKFLDNTQEIIILSFKEFPGGFESDTDHINFIKYLEREFAGYFLRTCNEYEWNVTLGHIWKTGRRLIMSYDHKIHKNRDSLWSPIKQYWGNVQDLAHLKEYIESAEEHPQPRAVMAQLTFDTWGIMKNVGAHFTGQNASSILQLGAMVGPHITQWYSESFYTSANIVAVDFIDATGIVEVAIEWNDRKFSPCSPYYCTWSPITQIWGNVQDLAALKNHLISAERIMIEPRASMAQITFDTWGAVKNSGAHFFGMETSSLLQLGAMVGPHITQWPHSHGNTNLGQSSMKFCRC
ncbi:hypothetical protein PV327_006766 [Microctonus hyperodae]|uniref:Phosphatidylinositol-specific phospholipase C X domain-containing protein n=1 Tax=Microctonus hyperodae TaxID=165561 RepID=A0AA39F523_MICHY|nr:hypothetical protein PV327_006766 [Microctonus hyperodae]